MKFSFIVNSIYFTPDLFARKVLNKLAIPEGTEVRTYFTEKRKHAFELAKIALKESPDLILAFGGDGTMHEIINGCMDDNIGKNSDLIIGQFPSGSGNDLARTFQIRKNINELNSRLAKLETKKIDLGILHLENGETEYFDNATSFGFGAEVIKKIESRFWSNGFKKSYFKSIISTFNTYKPTPIQLIGDDFVWEGNSFLTVVANGRYLGGGLSIAPQASPFDGKFSITIVGEVSMWEFFSKLRKITGAKVIQHPQIFYFESSKVEIHSDSPSFSAETDGELISPVPKLMICIPKAINYLV